MRLYHPDLDRTHDFGDSDLLYEVLKESGWRKTIPADHSDPAHAAEQPDVVYQPVPAADQPAPAKPARKSAKEAATTD